MNPLNYLWWRSRKHLQTIALFWITSVLIGLSEACSTRGAPKPRSPNGGNGGGTVPGIPGHQTRPQDPPAPVPSNATIPHFECPSAYQKWYCLNGATCFAVKIGDTILYNCLCVKGYQGQRCEYKDTDESYSYLKARTLVKQATIAGVTTASIFIVIIVITAITIYVKRRRQKLSQGGAFNSTYSVEAMQRMPFGRTLSRTEPYLGQPKSPTGGQFSSLATAGPSTSGAFTQTATRRPEQEALLTRVGMAPVARTSDTSLSSSAQDEVILTMEPENAHNFAPELPHPYTLSDGSDHPARQLQKI